MKWLLRLVFLCSVILIAYGIVREALFSQWIWTPEGMARWRVATIGYWAVAVLIVIAKPAWIRLVMAGALLMYTIAAIGILPVLATVYFAAGLLALGWWMLRPPSDDLLQWLLAFAAGAAAFVVSYSWLAATGAAQWLAWGLLIPLAAAVHQWVRTCAAWKFDPLERPDSAAFALAGFPVFLHWLLVWKPEVSADGLAMHLAIPMRIAKTGFWDFDTTRSAWAVMPMGGDWLYTACYLLGGEFAARFWNWVALVALVTLIYAGCKRFVERRSALLLAGLFASTPIVQLVTGSMFVENVWALLCAGGAIAFWEAIKRDSKRMLLGTALILGGALNVKFGSIALVVILLMLAWILLPQKKWAAVFVLVVLAAGAFPYWNAWHRTGNPLYPFLSHVFDPNWDWSYGKFEDPRFHEPLTWRTLYDMTFQSSRFLEGQKGNFGLQHLLWLPVLAIVVVAGALPLSLTSAIAVVFVFAVGTLLSQANLRYLYPAMALWTILSASLVELLRTNDRLLARAFVIASIPLLLLNSYFLGSSGWYHADLSWEALRYPAEKQTYLDWHTPERAFIPWLNANAPGDHVAFLTSNRIAGLEAQAFTATWHTPEFWHRLMTADSALAVLELIHEKQVRWVIAPKNQNELSPNVAEFVNTCTNVVEERGALQLRKMRPDYAPLRSATSRPPVLRGKYDDANLHLLFKGTWMRDRQFAETVNRTLTYTDQIGDSVQLTFVGTELVWRFTRAFNRGIASVEIDGKLVGEVDQYAADTQWRSEARFSGLKEARHTAVIRILPKRNPGAKGNFIDVDELEVR